MAFHKKGKKCKLDSIVCLHEMCVKPFVFQILFPCKLEWCFVNMRVNNAL